MDITSTIFHPFLSRLLFPSASLHLTKCRDDQVKRYRAFISHPSNETAKLSRNRFSFLLNHYNLAQTVISYHACPVVPYCVIFPFNSASWPPSIQAKAKAKARIPHFTSPRDPKRFPPRAQESTLRGVLRGNDKSIDLQVIAASLSLLGV